MNRLEALYAAVERAAKTGEGFAVYIPKCWKGKRLGSAVEAATTRQAVGGVEKPHPPKTR
jgi:hypothetical protein